MKKKRVMTFDPDTAKALGIKAATMMMILCEKEKNFRLIQTQSGNSCFEPIWFPCSISDICKEYPFFSNKQCRVAITELEAAGLLEKKIDKIPGERMGQICWYKLNDDGGGL